MYKEVLRLIENSRKNLDKKSQRAELLIRNEKFQEDLNEFIKWLPDSNKFFLVKKVYPNDPPYTYSYAIPTEKHMKLSKKNILIKLKYTKYKRKYWIEKENKSLEVGWKEDHSLQYEYHHRASAFSNHLNKWMDFCDRWLINSDWDGKLESLYRFQRSLVEIYYNDSIRRSFEDKDKWIFLIRFNAWTTLEDIKNKWHTIEKIQKKILGKPEQKANFGRDLCWYELYKNHKKSPSKIAKLWIEYCPEEIDLLVIRRIKGDIKKAIEKEEKLKEFRGRVLEEDEILETIKSGKLVKKVKDYYDFEEERRNYISGKYPSFIEVIKKAIKRMRDQINNHIYPQPAGIDFLFIKRAKEIDNKVLITL